MKITDVKCTVLGNNPVVRLVTDAGVSGYGGPSPISFTATQGTAATGTTTGACSSSAAWRMSSPASRP